MALGNEIRHCHRQQQRLIDLPRAKCLAHAKGRNLTRPSLTSKIRYYSDRLLGIRTPPRGLPRGIFAVSQNYTHRPRPGFGYVRTLSQQEELPLLRDHLLRLDAESRHDRFNGYMEDEFVERY